jgi:putative tricarboxylic transport membrane protein
MGKLLTAIKKSGDAREIAPLVLTAVFFIYELAASFSLQTYSNDFLGSNFMPRIVSIIALVCIAGICISKVLEVKSVNEEAVKEHTKEKTVFNMLAFLRNHTVPATLVLIALYITIIGSLGFLISSFLYLFIQITLLTPKIGKRALAFNAVLSAVFSTAIYFLFVKGFLVILPAGILG